MSCLSTRKIWDGTSNLGWDVAKALEPIGTKTGVFEDLDAMVKAIVLMSKPRDQILVMSNGGFGGVRKDFGGVGGAGDVGHSIFNCNIFEHCCIHLVWR